MRPSPLLLGLMLACPVSAQAFTIDFEAFALGPLPTTHSTPWGDLEFHSGRVVQNPQGPGAQMANGVVANEETLFFLLPDETLEVTLTLVNLNPEERFLYAVAYQDRRFEQDYGFAIPAQGSAVVEWTFFGGGGGGGFEFRGVAIDFEDRCDIEPTTCNDLWGLDTLVIVPEPGPAGLLAAAFAALAGARRAGPGSRRWRRGRSRA